MTSPLSTPPAKLLSQSCLKAVACVECRLKLGHFVNHTHKLATSAEGCSLAGCSLRSVPSLIEECCLALCNLHDHSPPGLVQP